MFQPKPDAPLWTRDLSRAKRARDGSGYAAQSASMLFRPAEATEGSPTHGRARASAGAARAKSSKPASRI